ncbi:MAG: methyltransferase domain-containing protein [Desulfonatronovibrio sp. MSAO_Bac4]|nr:MAG: methyltransferase domain-containing protein [Desulfonatronovibrio sp. MSAO_Bac4]
MYSLTIKTDQAGMELIEPLLYSHITWGWEESDSGTITIHFASQAQLKEFKELIINTSARLDLEEKDVQETDWSQEWKKFFTPIEIDDTFIILPEWLEDSSTELTKILITPKMAFGTGHHATTYLCLSTLSSLLAQDLNTDGLNFLDLGTGSGILGIACAKAGLTGIGVDIDKAAVDNARENITLNQVEGKFQVKVCDLQNLDASNKYNIIFANILASTLKDMRKTIVSLIDSNRYCLILSGILREQAEDVVSSYQELGLGKPMLKHQGEWSAVIWNKLFM